MTDPVTAAERLTEADDLRATLAIRDRQLRDALDLAASRRPQVPGETAPEAADLPALDAMRRRPIDQVVADGVAEATRRMTAWNATRAIEFDDACSCAMTEATMRTCPKHGEDATEEPSSPVDRVIDDATSALRTLEARLDELLLRLAPALSADYDDHDGPTTKDDPNADHRSDLVKAIDGLGLHADRLSARVRRITERLDL